MSRSALMADRFGVWGLAGPRPSSRAWRIMPSTSRLRRIDSRDEGLKFMRVTQRGINPPPPRALPSSAAPASPLLLGAATTRTTLMYSVWRCKCI